MSGDDCSSNERRETMLPKSSVGRLLIALAVTVGLVAGAGALSGPRLALGTSGPCEEVTEDPDPPTSDPEPLIAGTIADAQTATGISGATVRLYRCDGTTATQVYSNTTASGGHFHFFDLTGPKWYYVAVDQSGPLEGMAPANTTTNPTSLIAVGPGDSDLLLEFE
jgi:hypothetical protein